MTSPEMDEPEVDEPEVAAAWGWGVVRGECGAVVLLSLASLSLCVFFSADLPRVSLLPSVSSYPASVFSGISFHWISHVPFPDALLSGPAGAAGAAL